MQYFKRIVLFGLLLLNGVCFSFETNIHKYIMSIVTEESKNYEFGEDSYGYAFSFIGGATDVSHFLSEWIYIALMHGALTPENISKLTSLQRAAEVHNLSMPAEERLMFADYLTVTGFIRTTTQKQIRDFTQVGIIQYKY